MKWAAVVDGIGERFALTLVAAVWLLTLGVVAILGERVNADSLAALRASGGKEVIGMKRSYVLALALCAGCAVGDPAGGSSLLPASDAGGGSRAPVPVVGVDSSADVVPVVLPDAGAPDAVPPADALALPVDALALPACPMGQRFTGICSGAGGYDGNYRWGSPDGPVCVQDGAAPSPCVMPLVPGPDPVARWGMCWREPVVVVTALCRLCVTGGRRCQ